MWLHPGTGERQITPMFINPNVTFILTSSHIQSIWQEHKYIYIEELKQLIPI